jgi:sec-independent protein translocase protein TatB
VFNFSGSEIVFLLLLALIILGPEKLPEAVRKFGSTYAELKKMSTGFQSELKQALDEPMREMRETADAFKKAATFDVDLDPRKMLQPEASAEAAPTAAAPAASPTPPVATSRDDQKPFESTIISGAPIIREPGLNFASAAPNRGVAADETPDAGSPDADATAPEVSAADIAGAAPPLAPRPEQPSDQQPEAADE